MTLFTFQGAPVRLHSTFFLIAAFYIISGALSQGIVGGLVSLFVVIILFGSVLLHEMGHTYAAGRYGIRTRSITLHILGGLASLEKEITDPNEEIVIALAGPAVNLVLLILFLPLYFLGVPGGLEVCFINAIMGVFNLAPAYPMDGGRVLRAVLTKHYGARAATRKSLVVAMVLSWGFLGFGIYSGWIGLAIIGGFLLFLTHVERKRLGFIK